MHKKRPVDMKREAKVQARLEKLGVSDPVCGMCGEADFRCFELHHVAGQQHDEDFMVQICANDHRRMTFEQCLLPAMPEGADPFLYTAGRMLIGVADMLAQIIAKFYEVGMALIERSFPALEGKTA